MSIEGYQIPEQMLTNDGQLLRRQFPYRNRLHINLL
jgi:hypothetical protein